MKRMGEIIIGKGVKEITVLRETEFKGVFDLIPMYARAYDAEPKVVERSFLMFGKEKTKNEGAG